MRDRTIDVSTTSKDVFTTQNFYRFAKSGGLTTSVPQFNQQYVRKRIPTGGERTIPDKEKPFTNVVLTVQYPTGSLWVYQDLVYQRLYQGVFGNNSFAVQGGTLHCNMQYPYGVNGNLPASSVGINPDLLSQAEVKALNKLRDKTEAADVDFGLWYAERHETLSLFKTGAIGIRDLAFAIARKDLRKSVAVLKDAFGVSVSAKAERKRHQRLERWLKKELRKAPTTAYRTMKHMEDMTLTYNLGVSPLLKDLKAAHQALLRGTLPERMRLKAVSLHSRSRQDVEVVKFGSTYPTEITTTFVEQHGYTVTLIAQPLNTEVAKLQRLGLTNPPALLYQATRLTFILDYFYALGPYLDAMTIPLGFEWIDGSWTQRVVRNVTFTAKSPFDNVMRGRHSLMSTKRTVYKQFPVPIPPLSLREKFLNEKQALNTSLIALKSFRSLVGLG